ncbi:MAG TPA: alpha/beta hydrolase [Candidatus Eisenbacteria bacterium]|nr:alpha/beta hydrolase [Candidatus Eisenbacteria bacterium]
MTSVDLHVRESGAGRPLLLLHAFPLSSAMWLEQRNALADVCRVITPDLRGFGGSQLDHEQPSLDRMADDVAALVGQLGAGPLVLGGLSMGGYVAMALLRRHPHLVSALVLADTKATADPPAARENRERIAAVLEQEQSARVLVDDVLPGLCGETTKRERPLVHGRVRALVEGAPPAAAAWAQRAMAGRPDSTDTLRTADVPALVVVGEEDTLSPPADAEAMVTALPQGRLVVIPGAGHLTAVEAPEAFTAALREFVAALDEGGGPATRGPSAGSPPRAR